MNQQLNLLVQSSNYYAPFAGVMLTSLFESNKDIKNITVYLLTTDMSEENRGRFQILAKQYERTVKFLNARKIDDFLEKESVPKWKEAYATYYKLFAISMIEEDIDRLVYLDSDMLVVNSLSHLVDVDLQDNIVAMCIDTAPERHKNKIGVTSQFYYNAGLIVFDVEKWKSETCIDKTIYHIKNVQAKYPIGDQDLINVVLLNRILTLPIIYNVPTFLYLYENCSFVKNIFGIKKYYSEEEFVRWKSEGVVLHCFPTITLYPWNADNVHPKKDLWNQYMMMSPWSDFLLVKNNKKLIYSLQRYCYKILPHKTYAFVYRTMLEVALWYRAKKAGIK